MFSVVPVCNQGRGSHVTIPYGALDVNVQVLLAPELLPAPTLPPTPDMGYGDPLAMSPFSHGTWRPPSPDPGPPTNDIWWPLLGTSSNLNLTVQGPSPTRTDI